ncbi:MAG: tRNA lysidine(34) synthetase TilS, partial [Ferruginibacter sp.]
MNLLKDFKEYIKKERLFQPKDKLLLAVSGGVDSVVLCELCYQAKLPFAIAHCNFQLRGAESERDEQFVTALAKKYAAELFLNRFDTEKYAAENKLSIQVAARNLRYNWFNEIIDSDSFVDNIGNKKIGKILTAHHADDNVETLLMNFFKGTGINGMKGILPKQGRLIRPLLFAYKKDLAEFATANDLSFVEDSSNISDKYTRNYFRNQLIPIIQQVFPKVTENLRDNLERFREIDMIYSEAILQHKEKLLVYKGEEVHIPVLKLKGMRPIATVVYEIIKDYNFTAHQVNDVIGLLESDSGKYINSSTHKIFKNRNWLIINLLNNSVA